MENHVPRSTANVTCPGLKKDCEVDFEVNVFRGATHDGVEVSTCSEFLLGAGVPECGHECIRTLEAQKIHEEEIRTHQEELSKIGPNVLG